MTCSLNNFPRGKEVDPYGTGTKVYADHYANILFRRKGVYFYNKNFTHARTISIYCKPLSTNEENSHQLLTM